MRPATFHRCALGAGLTALLAGCGATPPAAPLNHAAVVPTTRTASSGAYTLLHAFAGGRDGSLPVAPLVALNGTLYGTTEYGGTGTCNLRAGARTSECGTVFAITPSGKETVIYRFTGRPSGGQAPVAGLTVVNGKLYGVTMYGGIFRDGMAFATTTAGVETTIDSFDLDNTSDAEGLPESALLKDKRLLYGTTAYGGGRGCRQHKGCGTVFSMTTSGDETVIYKFAGSPKDGEYPSNELLDVGGTLYGTTAYGGANGSGTVFAIAQSGVETVLHSFGSSGDGKYPRAGLIDVNGMLYGTTANGGAGTQWGTVFAISTAGQESVIHSFDNQDGASPYASLVDVGDTLYGTTRWGGANGDGTVFSMTPSGTETVLHSFAGHADGSGPLAALISVNGALYGTTSYGGNRRRGAGTVFSLKP